MAVVFNHRLMHEGEPLGFDPAMPHLKKYFMRSEVMFKNVSPAATKLTENDEKALLLVQEADNLEFNGQAVDAAKLWSKAFKLSPALEAHYNQDNIVD